MKALKTLIPAALVAAIAGAALAAPSAQAAGLTFGIHGKPAAVQTVHDPYWGRRHYHPQPYWTPYRAYPRPYGRPLDQKEIERLNRQSRLHWDGLDYNNTTLYRYDDAYINGVHRSQLHNIR